MTGFKTVVFKIFTDKFVPNSAGRKCMFHDILIKCFKILLSTLKGLPNRSYKTEH